MSRNAFKKNRSFSCPLALYFLLAQTIAAQSKGSPQATDSNTSSPSRPDVAQDRSVPKSVAPKPGIAKAVTTKVPTQEPLLPPIVHDFTSVLESPGKNATSAQLRNIVAFVSSDKGHSYSATVETLAPGYAIVTNPVPSGETPISVLIGNKQAGARTVNVQLTNLEVTKNVIITGDFSDLNNDTGLSECAPLSVCALLLAADGQTVVGDVIGITVSSNTISVTFKAPSTTSPTYIRLGKKRLSDLTLPFPGDKSTSRETLVKMRQVIAADFCQRTETDCTTDFLKPHNQAKDGCSPDPVGETQASDPKCHVVAAYVLPADDSEYRNVSVNVLGIDTVEISFSAPSSFKPAWLVIATKNQSYRYAYTPAAPTQTIVLNYESDELDSVCDSNCALAAAVHLKLKSLGAGQDLTLVALEKGLIVARVTSPMGQEPTAIIVSNKDTHKSAMARRTIKPGQNVNTLQVDMTIMDQVTVQRNYGNRIAKRYIAVTLDVKNPTSQKVQFNKSAIYFDVDYAESMERKRAPGDYWEAVKEVSTLGTYQPSVYKPPFVTAVHDKKSARVARFGLEQNVKHAPVNYLSALGSFDSTAEQTDAKLKVLELVGSVLSNIVTGGVVADASGAFRAGTAVFSSTFLPGVRAIVLNTSSVNRLRSNMVAQTLQETVQVPPSGSTTTIVLLPRAGILGYLDAEIPVIVSRVIDVHIVPQVVTEVTETQVKKGVCKPDLTKDQARQAFGEPTGLTTNSDGSATFSYNIGPIASVEFSTKAILVSCKTRTPTDQLNLATTLVAANQILSDLNLNATKTELTDGTIVLHDITGVLPTYHFDTKGNRISEYVFLFDAIRAETNKAKKDFETFIKSKAKELSAERTSKIEDEVTSSAKAKPSDQIRYESPDIQNGWIMVTYKNGGTDKSAPPPPQINS